MNIKIKMSIMLAVAGVICFVHSLAFGQGEDGAHGVVVQGTDVVQEYEYNELTDRSQQRLLHTDGTPAKWDWGFDITVQGGSNGTTQLFVIPTNIGLSTSISLGFHNKGYAKGNCYGLSVQYEAGRLFTVVDPDERNRAPKYDENGELVIQSEGELWTIFEDVKGYFHSIALTMDFYFLYQTFVFRFGVGGAVFYTMPWDDHSHYAGGVRFEGTWQWLISDHLRAGIEIEVTTAFIWHYIRPSMVVTITL